MAAPPNTAAQIAAAYQGYLQMYHAHAQSPAASSSASVSAAAAGPSSASAGPSVAPGAPEGPKGQKARRLPQKALNIMREYYKVNPKPNAAEKRMLLEQIHKIEGCQWYSFGSVTSWFSQSHKRLQEPKVSVLNGQLTPGKLWPTLTAAKIAELRVLRREKPAKVDINMVIPTWAEALKSTEAHIRAWLTYNPEEEEEDQLQDDSPAPRATGRRSPHLPTPEATASPEPGFPQIKNSPTTSTVSSPVLPPFSSTTPTIKQQPYSPVQTHFIPAALQHAPHAPAVMPHSFPVLTLPHYAHHGPQYQWHQVPQPAYIPQPQPPAPQTAPPQTRPKVQVTIPQPALPQPVQTPPAQVALSSLAASLKDVQMAPPADISHIASLEDFDKEFEPYERMMRDLLRGAQNGAYASLGLDPADIPELEYDEDEDEDFEIDEDAMSES